MMKKLNQFKVNPKNPQKFDDLSKLKASVKDFPKMFKYRPMIHDTDGTMLGGNKRLICLQELGFKEIPDEWAVCASDLTEEEKQRFIIADNVGFGEWDTEILEEFWDTDDLTDWGVDLPEEIEQFDGNIDDFFENAEEQEQKAKEVICPHCGMDINTDVIPEKDEEK